MKFSVRINDDDVRDLLRIFSESERARILRAAVNKTLATGRTMVVREVTGQVRLKAAYVRDKTKIQRATAGRTSGTITVSGRPTLIARYQPRIKPAPIGRPRRGKRGKRGGVVVKVKRSGSGDTLRGVFLLPLRRGQASGGGGLAFAQRQPDGRIKVLYGPSPQQVVRNATLDRVEPRLAQRLRIEVDRAVVVVLRKK